MNPSKIYIAISIVVLAIIAALVFFVNKNKNDKNFTPIAGLAFGFILAGIFWGEERLFGYSLTGVGVILAVIDIIKKLMIKE